MSLTARLAGAARLCLCLAATDLLAASPCAQRAKLGRDSTVNLRVDNDLFGGLQQDQGYSNGFLLTWVSPNLENFNDECLPFVARALNTYLDWLHPEGFREKNMTIGFGQVMYTPKDRLSFDIIDDDRPFAGGLMLSVGYNAREKDDTLRTSILRIGMVGPSSQARQVQDWWHHVIGVDTFNGWDHQLHDELVLQYLHERRYRLERHQNRAGWGWDLTGHWGLSIGNFATYVNGGGEIRFGYRIPDDLGTAPLRPAGENTSPVPEAPDRAFNAHLFFAVDARYVLYDITLDGNSFKPSHDVRKRPLVGDIGYGFAFYVGEWRFAVARYHRAREFEGQPDVPVYGTITVGVKF